MTSPRAAIATVSLYGDLETKLRAIAAARFDAVEIFAGDMPDSVAAARATRALCTDLGLAIDLLQPLRDFECCTPDALPANLARAEHIFDLAEALGAPAVLVCSNTADPIADDAMAADHLHRLAERAAARGLRIGYEALAWGGHVRTWDHAWRLVESVDHPALGLVLDSFHVLVRPEPWAAIADLPGDRIVYVQLGDAPIVDADYMSWRRNHSTLPGLGDLDLRGFVRAVLATGYGGPLSLEIFNVVDRTPVSVSAPKARKSLRSLLDACSSGPG